MPDRNIIDLMKVIEFYEQFRCIGAECPYTCCSGWWVDVDAATYAKYKREKGRLGWKLRVLTFEDKEKGTLIRRLHGACPFHTREKLCYLQEKGRMDLMPEVCRLFPRKSIRYGKSDEVTLELSCIRVAELFLQNLHRLQFVESEDEIPIYVNINYIDQDFYRFMMAQREKLLDYLWKQELQNENITEKQLGLAQKIQAVYEYVYAMNQWLAKDRIDIAQMLSLPLTKKEQQDGAVKQIVRKTGSYAFFPIPFVNEMIYGNALQERVEKSNPVLDRMVKLYDNYFGKVVEVMADEMYQRRIEDMLARQPELEEIFQAYFSYMIQQNFCLACEDYYPIKPVLLSILQLEFVMLFYLLEFMESGSVSAKAQAEILVCVEKALRHSASLNERIMEKIRRQFYL